MSNTYSLAQLQEMAVPFFRQFNTKKMFGTSDGQIFLMEDRARLHAGHNGKVYPLENQEVPTGTDAPEAKPVLSVAKLKEKLAEVTSKDELEQMLLDEVEGENRSSAIKAIEKRMLEIVGSKSPEMRGEQGGEPGPQTPEANTNA